MGGEEFLEERRGVSRKKMSFLSWGEEFLEKRREVS